MKISNLDWWKHCEDNNDADEWTRIALDYRHAAEVLKETYEKAHFPTGGVIIGGSNPRYCAA